MSHGTAYLSRAESIMYSSVGVHVYEITVFVCVRRIYLIGVSHEERCPTLTARALSPPVVSRLHQLLRSNFIIRGVRTVFTKSQRVTDIDEGILVSRKGYYRSL